MSVQYECLISLSWQVIEIMWTILDSLYCSDVQMYTRKSAVMNSWSLKTGLQIPFYWLRLLYLWRSCLNTFKLSVTGVAEDQTRQCMWNYLAYVRHSMYFYFFIVFPEKQWGFMENVVRLGWEQRKYLIHILSKGWIMSFIFLLVERFRKLHTSVYHPVFWKWVWGKEAYL